MRVLLINTNREKVEIAVPIGICYIATALKDAGYDVKVLDTCFDNNIKRSIENVIRNFKPNVIGLSIRNIDTTNFQFEYIYEPLKDIKMMVNICKQNSNAPIFIGGSAVSIMPKEMLVYLGCSYALVGNAERAIVEILERIIENKSFLDVKGLAYFNKGEFILNLPDRDEEFGRANMLEWIDFRPYKNLGGSLPIQSKRGCAFNCIYCVYNNIEGRNYRLRHPKEVVDEIESLFKRKNLTFFEFVDSTFNIPYEHAEHICRELISRKIEADFTATLNPLGNSLKFLWLMKEAGFSSITVTAETASDKILNNLRKNFTSDDLIKSAEYINKVGFTSRWCFIIGSPGETEKTINETLEFAEIYLTGKNAIVAFHLGLRIYPNTQLANIAWGEGIINKKYNLLKPIFYISHAIDIAKITSLIRKKIKLHPNFLLTVEQNFWRFDKYNKKICKIYRLKPPYWQHIPKFLSLPIISSIRHHRLRYIERKFSGIFDIKR